MSELKEEVQKRRTFAIISHPDAGKTTLTEKFLLYGGAIQEAGMVKEVPPGTGAPAAQAAAEMHPSRSGGKWAQ